MGIAWTIFCSSPHYSKILEGNKDLQERDVINGRFLKLHLKIKISLSNSPPGLKQKKMFQIIFIFFNELGISACSADFKPSTARLKLKF